MNRASLEDIREALIEELVTDTGSRRGSAAMVEFFEAGELELEFLGERAQKLASRLRELSKR